MSADFTNFDPQQLRTVRALVASFCDDQMSQEQVAQLEALVIHDRNCRRYYLRALRVHFGLPRHLGIVGRRTGMSAITELLASDSHSSIDEPAVEVGDTHLLELRDPEDLTLGRLIEHLGDSWQSTGHQPQLPGTFASRSSRKSSFLTQPRAWVIACSAIFVMAFIATAMWNFLRSAADPIAKPNQEHIAIPIAKISKLHAPQWQDGEPARKSFAPLAAGQELRLVSGWAEVTFNSGVTVSVQGPSVFRVESPNGGALDRGRIKALVPFAARGFAVKTPSLRIVDLGTEFGVDVTPRGDTEVHVLQGAVEVGASDRAKAIAPVQVTKGHAVRGDSQTGSIISIATDAKRFQTEEPTDGLQSPMAKQPQVVIAHYRLGEDDDRWESLEEAPQEFFTRPLIGGLLLQNARAPKQTLDTLRSGGVAVTLSGRPDDFFHAEAALIESKKGWLLEALVRPRDAKKTAVIVQQGGLRGEGFGLGIREGMWSGSYGGEHLSDAQFLVEPNVWTYLVLVHQGGKTSLSINGVAIPHQLSDPSARDFVATFGIGGSSDSPESNFEGDVDEVRLSVLNAPFDASSMLLLSRPK